MKYLLTILITIISALISLRLYAEEILVESVNEKGEIVTSKIKVKTVIDSDQDSITILDYDYRDKLKKASKLKPVQVD